MSEAEGHASTADLAAALRAEQRLAWRRGERVLVETYLQRHPKLAEQADTLLELIYAEVVLREEQHETPQLEEYLSRFPHFAGPLRDQFEVHGVLEGDSFFRRDSGTSVNELPTTKSLHLQWTAASPPQVPGYEVLGELGHGGMGVVWKARHVQLNRLVALKMIRHGSDAGDEELARFRTEAEAVARLSHPHIVQIYEIGDCDGRPYLALEFVDGPTLAQRLGGAPLAAREAAALLETLARTVHEAHARGIVHRDLKPANVLLQTDLAPRRQGAKEEEADPASLAPWRLCVSFFIPKITDFGLAKRLDLETGQTQSGALVGTPSYMAPEQASGHSRDVGPAADVYALGAVLYECLTGRPPFRGVTPLETLLQVRLQDPVAPSQLQPQCPRDLETICLHCLAKSPPKRYATALELADDLHRFLAGEPIHARPTPWWERAWKWARRRPAAAAALVAGGVLLIALAGFTVALRDARDRAQAARDQAQDDFDQAFQAVEDYLIGILNDPGLRQHDLRETRKALLQKALRYYANFVERHRDDPRLRVKRGIALQRLAEITAQIGDPKEALHWATQAEAVFATLDRPRDLAASQDLQGELFRKRGQFDEAQRAYEQSRCLRERLVEAHPDAPTHLAELAQSWNNLGLLEYEARKLVDAEKAWTEALRMRQRLLELQPHDPGARSDLAQSWNNLGVVAKAQGRHADAAAHYSEALHLRRQLVQANPRVPEYIFALVKTENNMAEVHKRAGRTAEAEAGYQEAMKLLDDLVGAHRSVWEYREWLARTQYRWGVLHAETKRPDPARAAYLKALDEWKKLPESYRDLPEVRRVWAGCLHALGRNERVRHHFAAAQKYFVQAIARYPAGRVEPGGDPEEILGGGQDLADRAQFHADLGEVYRAQRQLAEAWAAYQEAAHLREKLVVAFPQNLEYRHGLAEALTFQGLLYRHDPAAAAQALHKAMDRRRALVRDYPTNSHYTLRLGMTCYVQAELLCETGRPAEVSPWLRQAEESWQRTLDQAPKNADVVRDNRLMARSLQALVWVRLGEDSLAAAEVEALRREKAPMGPTRCYRLARVCALLAARAAPGGQPSEQERAVRAEAHARQALQLLQQAGRAYFQGPEAVRELEREPDFESLRSRPDYQTWLKKLKEDVLK